VSSPVAGDADVLLVPDIEASNLLIILPVVQSV